MNAETAPPGRPIKVLAVDADPGSLAAIVEALAAPNCMVETVSSGVECLRRILQTDYSLILLAVGLPDPDGMEVATLIRQVKRSSHIPIIFLTSPGEPLRPEFRGSGNGCVEYLAKPVDAALLQSTVAACARACGRSAMAGMGKVGEDLESIIRERTSSLIRANDDLRREVARRERAEAALLAARLEAEAANAAKSEFLANMSHEIRTPMNGIVGLLELVLQTPLSAEQREYLNLVKVSAGSLLTIINDVLDFSKIEAGSLELERTGFSLRETVGDTMKALAFEASRKNLELACDIEPELPDAVLGDPVRLRQIVTNLAGNAVKFTASGAVVLRVRRGASRTGEVACDFSITDSGIGIPAEKLKSIFAPFFQADTSTTRVYGGTGLGLTIAARLVEIMGGTIGVDSAVGKGSCFRFSLRFGEPDAAPQATAPDLRGLRVLVAAPPVTSRSLAADLSHWGAEVVEAEAGAAALACIAEAPARPFDLALLDDSLSGLDAYEAAARIKRGVHRGIGTAAVLSSIAARQRHAEQIEATGFVSLTKPVKQSELATLMNAVAERRGMAPRIAAVPIMLKRRSPALDVLLVEDNPINCRLAQQVLARAGHRVATAENGAAALAVLASRKFDVVLMDVQMPGMDGLEATRLIRERERQSGGHVPVIALTAHAMVQHRERCLKAGMDGFLVKPIRPQDLLDAVAGIDRAMRRAAHAGHKGTIDRAMLLERTGGDARLLADISAMLGDKGRRLMAEARAALKARDAGAGARLLHGLSGMFGSLAADAAVDMVGRLERLTEAADWRGAESEFMRLEWEMERLAVELGAIAAASASRDPAMSAPPGRSEEAPARAAP